MDAMREVEIRQEARFVLWALRCAIQRSRGDLDCEVDIARGFQLADVQGTSDAFWNLAEVLCSLGWSMSMWHGPTCCNISSEEIAFLKAFSETAERLREQRPEPAFWWRSVVPAEAVPAIDHFAREWLRALHQAGVNFPRQEELVSGLAPLENLVEPAGAARLH